MNIYNEIIVGSGPCAYAYLLAKKKLVNSILVTTDESNVKNTDLGRLHKKLEINGKLIVSNKVNGCYVSSAYGGLSNAWGGTLVKPEFDQLKKNYPNISEEKKWEAAYKKIINNMSKYRKIILHNEKSDSLTAIYTIEPNNEYGWENRELSITPCIQAQINRLGIGLNVGVEVKSIKWLNDVIKVKLSNGESLLSNKVVLAAGTTGNQLLINSEVDIKDHAPYQILTLSKRNKKSSLSPITNYHISSDSISVFYDLNKLSADFIHKEAGKLSAKIIEFLSKMFKVSMVLNWNDSTVSNSSNDKMVAKQILVKILHLIRHDHFPFFIRNTIHGEGFHYIDGIINNDYESLKQQGVVVLGGNRMKEHSFYNPSLTFMAHSFIEGSE